MNRIILILLLCVSVADAQNYRRAGRKAPVAAAPITMTFVRDSVRADNRDATSDGPTDENLSSGGGSNLYCGVYNPGAVEELIGFQFQLAIPQGSVIDSCFISTTGYDNAGTWSITADSIDIYIYEVDDAPAFDGAHAHTLLEHATVSTAKVRTTINAELDYFWTSPNLKDLLKLVITDRAGWASGNYVGFVFKVAVGDVDEEIGVRDIRHYISYGGSVGQSARIRVAYH
jgi:hypothetical protein